MIIAPLLWLSDGALRRIHLAFHLTTDELEVHYLRAHEPAERNWGGSSGCPHAARPRGWSRRASTTRATESTNPNAPATQVIHTTPNHPWLSADHGWLLAGDLHLGEPVRLLDGGTAMVVALHAAPGTQASPASVPMPPPSWTTTAHGTMILWPASSPPQTLPPAASRPTPTGLAPPIHSWIDGAESLHCHVW